MGKMDMARIYRFIVVFFSTTLIFFAACQTGTELQFASRDRNNPVRTVTIFYTNDEEGYLEPISDRYKTYGGAANLMAALRERRYHPNGEDSLLLSGGDMWTGPAISSWFQGASTVEVTNAMGYDAAAVGNHEFDFGKETQQTNIRAADFPFLSANVLDAQTRKPPDYVRPYVIREVNGVRVGIVGLTTIKTPGIVVPDYVKGLQFTDYEGALRRAVPKARAEGAELIIVTAHVCPSELRTLIPVASELSIPLMAGGHCHVEENMEQDGVRIIGAGSHWQAFAQIDIKYDAENGKVLGTQAELVPIEYSRGQKSFTPDREIEAIVAGWASKVDQELGTVIGYSKSGIKNRDWPLFNLLVDSWLWAYPEADIAISNFGGYREAIPPGEITKADIVAVWPFPNTIIEVKLTGKQVAENLLHCGGAVAGLTYSRVGGSVKAILKDGSDLDPAANYKVLVNSYIYTGGDGCRFSTQNPDGYDLGINFRDPAINWILKQQTSPDRPLELLLDTSRRASTR
jgi:2',3'-cyclic-nucleotide 2'-phosphodiesterase (5'-nucleotidase family)